MKVIEIRCDGCDILGDDGPSAYVVRLRLFERGWAHFGKRDYCPTCRAERVARGLNVR